MENQAKQDANTAPAHNSPRRDPQADKITALGQRKSIDGTELYSVDKPLDKALAKGGLNKRMAVHEMPGNVYCVSMGQVGPQNIFPKEYLSELLRRGGQDIPEGGISGKVTGSPGLLVQAEKYYRLAKGLPTESWAKLPRKVKEWRAEDNRGPQRVSETIPGDFQKFLDANPQYIAGGITSVYISKEVHAQLLAVAGDPAAASFLQQADAAAADGFGRGPTVQAPPLVVPPKPEPARVEVLPSAQKHPELASGAKQAQDNWSKHLNPQSQKPAGTRAGLRSDQAVAKTPEVAKTPKTETGKPATTKPEAVAAQSPYGITGPAAKLFKPQHP